MKRKVRIASLERDDSVLQEQLKSLMYVDRSSCGYPKKDKLIDEINFKNCMRLKRNTTSKLFVGITYRKKNIIHPEYSDAKNFFSHTFIHNLKQKTNIVQYLSIQMKTALKYLYIGEQCQRENTPNTMHHCQEW